MDSTRLTIALLIIGTMLAAVSWWALRTQSKKDAKTEEWLSETLLRQRPEEWTVVAGGKPKAEVTNEEFHYRCLWRCNSWFARYRPFSFSENRDKKKWLMTLSSVRPGESDELTDAVILVLHCRRWSFPECTLNNKKTRGSLIDLDRIINDETPEEIRRTHRKLCDDWYFEECTDDISAVEYLVDNIEEALESLVEAPIMRIVLSGPFVALHGLSGYSHDDYVQILAGGDRLEAALDDVN